MTARFIFAGFDFRLAQDRGFLHAGGFFRHGGVGRGRVDYRRSHFFNLGFGRDLDYLDRRNFNRHNRFDFRFHHGRRRRGRSRFHHGLRYRLHRDVFSGRRFRYDRGCVALHIRALLTRLDLDGARFSGAVGLADLTGLLARDGDFGLAILGAAAVHLA